jgi:protein-S-isoprenylcysteine O-methyltransferase Ste14
MVLQLDSGRTGRYLPVRSGKECMDPRRALTPASVAGHAACALAWAGILASGSAPAAFAFFLASRAAYVSFVGFSLRAQDASGWWTRRWGPEGGYHRFKNGASLAMTNDAAAIGLVCWTSRGSLGGTVPLGVLEALGIALVILGVGMKAWAVATLGKGSFYWRSFFIPPAHTRYVVAGPYRWFANPMYTVGYAQAYGVALCLASLPGLIAALVAQSLVLVLNHWAEKPHTERMRRRTPEAEAAA